MLRCVVLPLPFVWYCVVAGKMPPYNAPNYYFLSAEDMSKFGIARVETPKGYALTDVSDFTVHLVFLSLK